MDAVDRCSINKRDFGKIIRFQFEYELYYFQREDLFQISHFFLHEYNHGRR